MEAQASSEAPAVDAARKVYFDVGRFGHPFFVEQQRAAPAGFAYVPGGAGSDAGAPRRIALQGRALPALRRASERLAIRALSSAGYVRRVALRPPADCPLIHSAQMLVREAPVPYVVDFECVEVFCLYQRAALARPWARRALLAALTDTRCRLLLPWSEASRRGLQSAFGDRAAGLAEKTVTVLPAIAPRTDRPAGRGAGPLRVLFIGTAFEAKGGLEAVRAASRARESHDVTLDIVSDVPSRRRAEVAGAAGVTAHPWPVPSARLRQLFERAHVLLFPSHMDTLGFVMLEAMAHGMPVVATRHFAAPEIVQDGVSGLVVEGENLLYREDGLCAFAHTLPPPRSFRNALRAPSDAYVERLAGALASLAADRDLHARLAAGAFASVSDGRLSLGRRRRELASAYERALGG